MTNPELYEAITEHWGERCAEYDPGCFCCRAWDQFDAVAELQKRLGEAECSRDSHLEAWTKKSELLDKWQSVAGRLERTYKSIYTILGWMNEPPVATIERELCLMKERIAAIPDLQLRAEAAEGKLAAVRLRISGWDGTSTLVKEIYEIVKGE